VVIAVDGTQPIDAVRRSILDELSKLG
jgi:hypothetical protein